VKILICDSLVKSPFSTLRCILRHSDLAASTSHSLGFVRLETRAFYFAVRSLFVLTATLIIIAGFMARSAFADGEDLKENKRVYITAEKLIADSEAKCAEFIGNVRAVQEDTVITADRLKIFYKKIEDNHKNLTSDEGSIEKIISSGNVKINFDDKVAVAEHAVYTSETGVLVLTGPNSKVTSGTNFVSGEKITLYRAEDRMTVESGNKKRVEAVFYSKEKGIE
jgi:lipopolysaccharide export system protein LptA